MQYKGATILKVGALASTALLLILAAPNTAVAQANRVAATFSERYPAEPPETTQATTQARPATSGRAVRATRRVASPRRAPTRVLVVRRSFLDAGTDVQPGERKFLDYAFPPTHQAGDVVTNTGGRVGWHYSPMPGPFFPFFY
jgi:hypothetical protein